MVPLAHRIADALEVDAQKQLKGQRFDLGEDWDKLQQEALGAEEPPSPLMINIAMRFWDDWADCAQHDWLHHEPMTEEMWPQFASEITKCLREDRLTENKMILELFTPQGNKGIFYNLRRLLGLGT